MRKTFFPVAVIAVSVLVGCSVIRNAHEAQEAAEPIGSGVPVVRSKLDLKKASLSTLVSFAMTNRPSMTSARLAVEDARLRMKTIAADAPLLSTTPWTTPKIGINGMYSEASQGVSPRGEGDWRTYGDPAAGVSLDLLVYDFGRNRAQAQAQAERVVAAEQTLVDQGYLVFGEVSNSYFSFLQARSLLGVAITTRNDYAEQLSRAEARLAAGEAHQLDVLRAKVDLANAEQELVVASNDVQTTAAALIAALGIDVSRGTAREVFDLSPVAFGTVYRAFPKTCYTTETAYDLARTNSPEMCLNRAKLRAASRDVDYAIADLRPKVTASLSLNWTNPLWVWGWGVSAVQSLYEGFRKTTAVDRAVVALKSAVADVEAGEQKLSADLQSAISVRDNAVKAVLASIATVRSAKENLDMVTAQFAVGDASRIDLSAAVAQYWTAVGGYIKAFYHGQTAEAALYAIVGSTPVYREQEIQYAEVVK